MSLSGYEETVRKRANGENVPLPTFVIDTPMTSTSDSPVINKDIVKDRYDGYAPTYAEHAASMGSTMPTQVRDYLKPLVIPGTKLLDVAGGNGLSTSLLDASKVAISVMDLSSKMLQEAAKRPNVIKTVESDIDNKFPFPDGKFDISTCISAIEFAADLRFTLSEMLRVTKHGGMVLFTTDKLEDGGATSERIFVYDSRGFFSRRYSTKEVRDIVQQLGGIILQQGTHNAFRLGDKWIRYDYFLVKKIR